MDIAKAAQQNVPSVAIVLVKNALRSVRVTTKCALNVVGNVVTVETLIAIVV